MLQLFQYRGNAKTEMSRSSLSSLIRGRTPSEIARAKKNKKKRKRKKRNRRLREMAKRMAEQSGQEVVSDTDSLYSKMSSGMKINDLQDEDEDLNLNEDMLEFFGEESQTS